MTAMHLRLLLAVGLITVASQFFRASTGAIAPEIIADLGLSPQAYGAATGAFFLAIGLVQIPVGILFDRYGPRRVASGLLVFAVAGAVVQAVARDAADFMLARALMGVGCAGGFMSAVLLVSRWFAAERLSTTLSWVFAFSQIGLLLATTPMAAAAAAIGWRAAFWGSAAAAAAIAALFFCLVRDAPPGAAPSSARHETLGEALRGVWRVWRTPGLGPIFAIHTVAYASMATVLSVWAGPYLADVHGLNKLERGEALFAMSLAAVIGTLCVGPLDQIFNTRKWVVAAGAALTLCILTPLAAVSGLPFWSALVLLALHCAVTTYGIVIVAHGRSLFPPELAGRGVTTVNIAQVGGSAGLPLLTGYVIAAFPPAQGGGYAEDAYRAAFGVIALSVALGLAVYLRSRDVRPRG